MNLATANNNIHIGRLDNRLDVYNNLVVFMILCVAMVEWTACFLRMSVDKNDMWLEILTSYDELRARIDLLVS